MNTANIVNIIVICNEITQNIRAFIIYLFTDNICSLYLNNNKIMNIKWQKKSLMVLSFALFSMTNMLYPSSLKYKQEDSGNSPSIEPIRSMTFSNNKKVPNEV